MNLHKGHFTVISNLNLLEYGAILFKIILVLYSVLFSFGHIRRWDPCAVYILYSKISTNLDLLKIRHSHRYVAVVILIQIPFKYYRNRACLQTKQTDILSYWRVTPHVSWGVVGVIAATSLIGDFAFYRARF